MTSPTFTNNLRIAKATDGQYVVRRELRGKETVTIYKDIATVVVNEFGMMTLAQQIDQTQNEVEIAIEFIINPPKFVHKE